MSNGKEKAPICFNCKHWAIEPGVLDTKHLKIVRGEVSSDQKVPGIYGKCKASYIDAKGKEHHYNMGMRADTLCLAYDNLGIELFEPVPVDPGSA